MAMYKARQLDKARSHFASLVDSSPKPGLSYKASLLSIPIWKPKVRDPSLITRETRSSFVFTRLEEIKRRSTPTHPVCFRCGDRGHRAKDCRNTLICFLCNKTGHKSSYCHSITSIPFHFPPEQSDAPSSLEAMAPPGTRRGVARTRFQPFANRSRQPPIPPLRGMAPLIPPLRGLASPINGQGPPLVDSLQMPERMHSPPFPAMAPQHNRAPPSGAPMAQVMPDRPIQPRPRPPPPPMVPEPAPEPIPAQPPRIVHPPILMFNPSPESEAINRELHLSLLLDDIAAWGPEKVEKVLRQSYPPFKWRVAVFDEFIYVIQTPSEEWLLAATRKRWLRMEDIQFPIVKWDSAYNTDRRLTSVWVRLHGFPYDMWTWEEFSRVFSPYGAVVLELDPGTRFRYDYRFSRVRIGIGDPSALPTQHNITHRDPHGFVTTSDIDFEVETPETESVNAWRGRINGRPYPNGTHFGVIPPHLQPATPPPHPSHTDPLPQMAADHPVPTSDPPVAPTHPSPNLRSPYRNRRGIVINDTQPLIQPVLGSSPVKGKGKISATSCKSFDPMIEDYDSDESDEDSFQRALDAIHHMEQGIGSTSQTAPPPPPPPHSSQPAPHDLESPPASNHGATSPQDSTLLPPVTPTVPDTSDLPIDSEDEFIADIFDKIIDEEPLMKRATRLQAQKDNSLKKKAHSATKSGKHVRFSTPARNRRVPSPSPPPRKITPSKSKSAVKHPSKWQHHPRSPTKKQCPSSQKVLPPYTPDVVELSDTSTDYTQADDPSLPHEWRYHKEMPRRSFRFQIKHTHTPISKKAQKRKASGSSQSAGNSLFNSFPYDRFTVAQIEQLFLVYNIALGKSDADRPLIVSAIQHMGRSQFEDLLKSLGYQPSNTSHVTHIHAHHVLVGQPVDTLASNDCRDLIVSS